MIKEVLDTIQRAKHIIIEFETKEHEFPLSILNQLKQLSNLENINIEHKLGLDGYIEALICGCGKPAAENPIDPDFDPYIPRETIIQLCNW
jgi:hypothetical protein